MQQYNRYVINKLSHAKLLNILHNTTQFKQRGGYGLKHSNWTMILQSGDPNDKIFKANNIKIIEWAILNTTKKDDTFKTLLNEYKIIDKEKNTIEISQENNITGNITNILLIKNESNEQEIDPKYAITPSKISHPHISPF